MLFHSNDKEGYQNEGRELVDKSVSYLRVCMGNLSDNLFGSLILEGYFSVGMYEKGLHLADIILGKCDRMQLDTSAGISGIFRMKAEMLIALALQNPNENQQFRIEEAEKCLIRAFERLQNSNCYQKAQH